MRVEHGPSEALDGERPDQGEFRMRKLFYAGIAVALLVTTPVLAQSGSHAGHGGQTEQRIGGTTTEPKAAAVIHKIDAEKGVVNVTHDPIPALDWPEMTMDLPVTKRVDLSKFKAGEKVTITLKQGVDKQYRVIDMAPAK